MAAASFEAPELLLSPDEAATIADAAHNVSAHYNHAMDPKTLAWLNLAIAVGAVYGTRIFAIRNRLANQRTQAAAPPKLVTQIRETRNDTQKQNTPITPADLFGGGIVPEPVAAD